MHTFSNVGNEDFDILGLFLGLFLSLDCVTTWERQSKSLELAHTTYKSVNRPLKNTPIPLLKGLFLLPTFVVGCQHTSKQLSAILLHIYITTSLMQTINCVMFKEIRIFFAKIVLRRTPKYLAIFNI